MKVEIPLTPGDRVVSSFTWHDSVFVISEYGKVWLLKINERDGYPTIYLTQDG